MDTLTLIRDAAESLCRGGGDTIFCPRCIGVWGGAALALPVIVLSRRKTSLILAVLLTLFFLQMPVFGWGKIALPEAGKALSGQLFALGALYGLSACPTKRWLRGKGGTSKVPLVPFLIIASAGIGALQILLAVKKPLAVAILDYLSLVGMTAALLLAPVTLLAVFLPGRKSTSFEEDS